MEKVNNDKKNSIIFIKEELGDKSKLVGGSGGFGVFFF